MSIKNKLILTMVVLSVIVVMFILFYFPQKQTDAALDNAKFKAAVIGAIAEEAMRAPLEFNDKVAIEESTMLIRKDPECLYILVKDSMGKDIYFFDPKKLYNEEAGDKSFISNDILHYRSDVVGKSGQRVGWFEVGFSLEKIYADRTQSQINSIIIGIILLVIGLASAFMMASTVVNTIKSASAPLLRIAQGDLDFKIEYDKNDEFHEFYESYSKMLTSFQKGARSIREAASKVINNSDQIMQMGAHLSSATSQQASAITETSTTVEEVKRTSEQSFDRAKEIVSTSDRSVTATQEGMRAIDNTIKEMVEVQEHVRLIVERISDLQGQMNTIGEIIESVNDIAEQSNLLAVNASIEAAKAGEYGKGFAVVASEVKNLANQSKDATNRIKTILQNIKEATDQVSLATSNSSTKVDGATNAVNHAGNMINQLASVISEVAESAKQIVSSANQQLIGIEQIAIAIDNINQATNETLSGAHNADAASKSLHQIAVELERTLEHYQE